MWYYDWYYLVLVLPAIVFALIASAMVKHTFKKYSKVMTRSGMTGYEAARAVLDANNLQSVGIGRVSGDLTDHFDPRTNTVNLSDTVYDKATCAAIGVAAHEAGHAVQHAQGYIPAKIRSAIVPATNLGSKLAFPLVILGIILMSVSEQFILIAYIGAALFGLCVVFQLVTLPTEFNASRRALAAIEAERLLLPDEQKGAKKVLSAAAMTYVAALAVAIMQMIRLLMIISKSRKN